MSRLSVLRRLTSVVGIAVSTGLIWTSIGTATTASAQVPSDVKLISSGKYLTKAGSYKFKVKIPKSKPNGTDLGKIKVTNTAGGTKSVFTTKIEKANNARLRVTLSQTPYDSFTEMNRSDAPYRQKIWAYALRLNGTWKYVDPDSARWVYKLVVGKDFYVQAMFYFTEEIWDFEKNKFVVTNSGFDTTNKVKIVGVTSTR